MSTATWKSKVTGAKVKVTDGWNHQGNYYVTLTFNENFDDTQSWIRLDYKQFIEAFEKEEE